MQYCQGKVLLCVADEARKTGYLDDPRIMSLKFSDKWVQWLIILSNKSSAAMSCIPSGSQPPIDDDMVVIVVTKKRTEMRTCTLAKKKKTSDNGRIYVS